MEVEVKAKASDLALVEKKLKGKGARLVKKVVQNADYYLPENFKRFSKNGPFPVRLRREGNKTFLTYKKQSANQGAWLEFETAIGNPDQMEKILRALGFKKAFSVNKTRKEYSLANVNYCLDDVKGLGKFVEVEAFSSQGKKTLAKLKKLLHSLSLFETTGKGYVQMLAEKR